jgi:leucyl aminopeptidase
MRRALLVTLLFASTAAHATTYRWQLDPSVPSPLIAYITVDPDAVPTLSALIASDEIRHMSVVDTEADHVVLSVRRDDLDRITQVMHEHHGRCGGFIVHDSLDDARQALSALRDSRPIDYTLDRPADVRATVKLVDENRIRGTIAELQAMGSRYYKSQTGADASRWLAARWRTLTPRTDVTIELVKTGYPQKTVVMTVPGTTRASEVIVIGGHLDSISLSGFSSDAPGADDDASGIATLTEVARVLLAQDYRPARTIQFVAYAAEEVGLVGSQQLAKSYKQRGIDVVGALQLDMTNYQGSDKDIWLMKDFTSAAQNQFLIELIETYVGATWGLDACGYACSDHASWTRIGVPASMPFESRMNQRNKHIHTGRDTLETSGNNAAHAAKFARLGAAYAIELGKGELAARRGDTDDSDRNAWALAVLGLLAGAGLWLSRVRA